jgi:FkbM family methyltransferase
MEIDFKGNKFIISKGSTHPEYSIFTFTGEEVDFKNKYWDIKPDDIVFDVGSSYGTYALTATAMGAKVFCFEPESTVYCDLVNNIKLNNWEQQCIAHNLALWSCSSTVDMKDYAPHWPVQTITSLYPTDTLDNIVNKNNLTTVNWIKIDVEGSEEQVLLGAQETITKFSPNMIIECHNFLDNQISNRIKEMILSYNSSYNIEEIERDPCVMLVVKLKERT